MTFQTVLCLLALKNQFNEQKLMQIKPKIDFGLNGRMRRIAAAFCPFPSRPVFSNEQSKKLLGWPIAARAKANVRAIPAGVLSKWKGQGWMEMGELKAQVLLGT